MCGIGGSEPFDATHHEQVLHMNDTLIPRGPDASRIFLRPHAILAMRRLRIIDLSTGWQRLYNEDKSLALIANGKIYDFVALVFEYWCAAHLGHIRHLIECRETMSRC